MLLGTMAARGGDLRGSEPYFRKAVESEPGAYEPREWLAIVLRETGRLDEALAASKELVRLRPHAAGAHSALGLCLLKMREAEAAVPPLAKAVELEPRSALFRRNLGVALKAAGRYEEALRESKAGLDLEPRSAQSYLAVASIHSDRHRPEEAVPFLEKAAEIEPTCLTYVQLAVALSGAGRHEEAELMTERAIRTNPKSVQELESLGVRLMHLGRFEDAEISLREAMGAEPNRAGPYFEVVRTRKANEGDRDLIAGMERMLSEPGRDEEDRRKLHYAIAKCHEDLGEYDRAIGHFHEANALSKRLQLAKRPYDPEAAKVYMERTISVFSRELFESHRDVGSDSDMPVFIVGMIRSGTTLLERLVSSHRQVAPAGELAFWIQEEAASACAEIVEGRIDRPRLRRLAESYLSVLARHAGGRPHVTDKMPLNYHMVGAIHLVLPNARFIHCRRSPADTCTSIYTTPFTGAPDFFYDIDNIVDGYRHYERLMEHWRATVPPDRFHEVIYEDIVAAPGELPSDIVRFLGLRADDRPVTAESNLRAINTPSSWQVRQPVYSSSVGRWKRYEPWLGAFGELMIYH